MGKQGYITEQCHTWIHHQTSWQTHVNTVSMYNMRCHPLSATLTLIKDHHYHRYTRG